MPNNEVKLIITTDASGAITAFNSVQSAATSSMNKIESDTSSFASKIKNHWLAISAAGYAAYATINKAAEYMSLGARAMQAEESFKAVTASFNVNADSMLSKMRQVSLGMIDDSDLMQKSVQGFMLGLDDKKMIGLLDASRNAAKVWGQDVGSTFDTLVTSVGGGVRAMQPLVRMGLITKEEFQDLNKAIESGAEEMDLYSLVQARATLQTARFSNEELNALERSQKFHAEINELKETIGKGLVSALQYALGGFQWLAAGALEAYTAFKLVQAGEAELRAQINRGLGFEAYAKGWEQFAKGLRADAEAAKQAAEDLIRSATDKFGGGTLIKDDPERAKKIADAQKIVNDFDARLKALANKGKTSELAQAIIEWEKRIALLNPALDATDKKLLDINEEAKKLREKFGNADWIQTGLTQGIAFINQEQLNKARQGLREYVQGVIEARDAAVKKEAEAEAWLAQESAKYSQSETAFKEQQLLDEFSKRAEILGWTEELYKTFQAGLTRIDDEAKQKALSEEANYQRSLIDVYEKMHTLDPTEAARQRVEQTQKIIAADEQWLNKAVPGTEYYLKLQKDLNEERKKLLEEDMALIEREGTMWDGMIEAAKRYQDAQLTDYQKGMEIFNTMTSSMENHIGEFFDYQNKGWMNWKSLTTNVIHDVYQELMKLYVVKPLVGDVKGLITSLFGGGSSTFTTELGDTGGWLPTGGFGYFHQGGRIPALVESIPHRHSGGLRANERLTVNKVGERYISEEQDTWLKNVAKTMDRRAAPPIVNLTVYANDANTFLGQAAQVKSQLASLIHSVMQDNHPIRRT